MPCFILEKMERIRFSEYASPLGRVFVATTGQGICRVAIGGSRGFFVETLKGLRGPSVEEAPSVFSPLFGLFDRYFAGEAVRFDLKLDLLGTDFERAVWGVLRTIPYGEVRSYGFVAGRAGRAGGARAVGGACGRNPVPIIVPCHRVIMSTGLIGGYSAGVEIKRALLDIEGVSRGRPGRPRRGGRGGL